MSQAVYEFMAIDLPVMLTAVFVAVTCGLLGNFLVLRRLSLMGDAISHAVLPGIVVAFLITTSREPLSMFFGAAIAGVATVILVEVVHRIGGVETGAAMGVVFSILFALGVLLMEQAAADQVDLDAECVLHGQLESLYWFPPHEWAAYLSLGTWFGEGGLPRQVIVLACTLVVTIGFVTLLFKELRLAAFDPGLATTLGFNAGILHYVLMVFVAAAAVASFEAVGSILVIAMLICPAATARLLTDRLRSQLIVSAAVGLATGLVGYWLGARALTVFGWGKALDAAGMMAVVAGALLGVTIVLSPSHGVVARTLRRRRLASTIAYEDLLAMAYRAEEAVRPLTPASLDRHLLRELRRARGRGDVLQGDRAIALTDSGRTKASAIVRSHRLWESYLVREAGLRPDHVHDTAMRLEHLDTHPAPPRDGDPTDPHGRPIPP